MRTASQMPLPFDRPCGPRAAADATECELIKLFCAARLAEGASIRSVEREASQLRSLAREATRSGQPVGLRGLLDNLSLAALALSEPARPIARSTGRARLAAFQRLLRVAAPLLGRSAATEIERLDAILPAARSGGWHHAGTLVAGQPGRRRRLGPALDATDLERIVAHAAPDGTTTTLRNRAVAILACYSGMRPEELARLRWEDLARDVSATGHYGLTVRVVRGGTPRRLLLPGRAADAVEALEASVRESGESPLGPVFVAQGAERRGLSYGSVRSIVCAACRRAGLGCAESVELRAAFAWWLKAQGLSDHEAAAVLGLERVRSLDRLLLRHRELHAQRAVRERLGP